MASRSRQTLRRRRRMVGGFTPGAIAGLKMWLAADNIEQADGTAIANWRDASGNGNALTQGTGTNQPTLQTNELNGKPVVRFDGTDDYLIATLSGALAQPNTIFVVGKAAGAADFLFGLSTARNDLYVSAGGNYTMYAQLAEIQGGANDGAFHVFSVLFSGAASKLHVGGGTPTTGNPGTASLGTTVRVGWNTGTEYLTGDIAEILVYNAGLTIAQTNQVGKYLANKYGLAWTTAT